MYLIIITFLFSNEEYLKIFLDYKVSKDDMLNYIAINYDVQNKYSDGYLMTIILKYIKSIFKDKENEEKTIYISQTIFKDGTYIINDDLL